MSDDVLYTRVAQILDQARGEVARTVNTAMVQAYWHIGREIVEVEQAGQARAAYGEEILASLAARLKTRFGRGFGVGNLRNMRQFFLMFPNGSAFPTDGHGKRSALPSELPSDIRLAAPSDLAPGRMFPPALSWTHYAILMRVANPTARAFYEIEAIRETWSTRALERQIGALLFDRLSRHKHPEQVLELARRGQEVALPSDVIKDAFVLEFLDLGEHPVLRERDIEQAIIDGLEAFLLEMGKGFCFVGRQKRLTVDGDHYYVDLVFYNRLLSCFVLVDLKLGKLTHQDLGQMQMYVNYFDRTQRAEHESKTIGIVLCSDKNAAMVKITLPEDNQQIVASTYKLYLPTEAELQAELLRERADAEQMLRLTAKPGDA